MRLCFIPFWGNYFIEVSGFGLSSTTMNHYQFAVIYCDTFPIAAKVSKSASDAHSSLKSTPPAATAVRSSHSASPPYCSTQLSSNYCWLDFYETREESRLLNKWRFTETKFRKSCLAFCRSKAYRNLTVKTKSAIRFQSDKENLESHHWSKSFRR